MADPGRSGGESETEPDVDVVVVGGGPAGCSAAVFTARDGLETVVFDRGPSSLARCAFLENYLGFPGGVDVETFTDLAHAHAEAVGARLVDDLVESVAQLECDDTDRLGGRTDAERPDGRTDAERPDGRTDARRGFRVSPQDCDPLTARFVIAATKYDGSYLRGLDDDALFETVESDESRSVQFDPDAADADGRTPVDGLYVAGPLAGGGDQVVVAAGHGATAARSLLRDRRRGEGYWGQFATRYDWLRRNADLREEWTESDRWGTRFASEAPADLSTATVTRLAEAYAEEYRDAHVDADAVDRRTRAGQRRLAAHLDDDVLLEAVDDDAVRAYADALDSSADGASPNGGS